ncbi:MAG TPA: hypothetical protein VN045_01060 [Microbacteriaceae bacterium]|nr:hypothetical protein [Microbacteriaceae bacterium]
MPGDPNTARLIAELRQQRALLADVAAEIVAGRRGLTVPADGSWHSPAQHEFATALAGVSEQLRMAAHALDAAVADLDGDIAALAAT